ncbi:DUF692 family multinuclear iron-containing protein [Nocardioides sp. NPDC047086]|uniref:multinuclear nonheme iron-dependent oxidase n=1 Tax=Nocardioides sp. NPDC047086 TaxID=3154810 RepID=UPI0033CF16E6
MSPSISGIAVAWRPAIAELLQTYAASGRLGFTEVVAENTEPAQVPQAVRDLGVPVIAHGVTLGLAGADRPAADRLTRLAELAEVLDSPFVSEHVAFVRASDSPDPLHGDVLEAGHLLPPPRTKDSLDVLVDNVRIAQDRLPVPLAVENIAATFTWPEDTISEPDFLTELVERTGVGLVLDVANLYASAVARGSDPVADLARFPLDAVAYVHVAGGIEREGLYIDTHAHPMPAPVLSLLATAVEAYAGRRLPGIMLERDAEVSAQTVDPEFTRLSEAMSGRQALGRSAPPVTGA